MKPTVVIVMTTNEAEALRVFLRTVITHVEEVGVTRGLLDRMVARVDAALAVEHEAMGE